MHEIRAIERGRSAVEAPPQESGIKLAHVVHRPNVSRLVALNDTTGTVLGLAARTRYGLNADMHGQSLWRQCRQLPLQILKCVDDALMPLRCVFCGTQTLAGERFICVGCHADLPWRDNPVSLPPAPMTALVAPLTYEFPVDAALKALKFKRRLYYAPAFGDVICDAMHYLPRDLDALLPVPLHWRRQAFRGFNQALELSSEIRRRLGLPLVRGVVRRIATSPQSGLSAAERRRNVRRAFVVRQRVTARHVLIVDDVVTTGATTRQLARTLLASGVEKVSVLAAATSTQAGKTGLNV